MEILKWNRTIVIFLLISPIIFSFVYSSVDSNTNSYLDPLTRSIADQIYCLQNGICNTTIVGNITINGDLDMKGFDIINVGDLYATEVFAELNWSWLKGFPTGCLSNQAVQTIGDTLTCVNLSVYNDTEFALANRRTAIGPYLSNDSDNYYFDANLLNNTIEELIGNTSINLSQLPDAWVNLTINSSFAFFKQKINGTNKTLELWVNGAIQQDWGASTTIYQEATFLDDAFFQNIFMENAGGDGIILLGNMLVVGNVTTNSTYYGNGQGLLNVCLSNGTGCNQSFINASELNITFPSGKAGFQPWLYNDSTYIYFNESYFNQTIQEQAEVKTYEEYINVTSSGGIAYGKSSSTLDFQITRITVTPSILTTQYRFEAVKDSNGEIIDKNRIKHTGVWDIEKAIAIDNDYVNITITQANPDDTFSVKITYIDNFN